MLAVDVPSANQKKPNSQEEIIYSDSNVSVTTTRAIIHGTTYALRNITSVKMASTPARTGCAIILFVAGIIYFLTALPELGRGGEAVFIGACVTIAVAVLWWCGVKADYHVCISSASGEANALTSKNEAYVERIVDSINVAIVKYQ